VGLFVIEVVLNSRSISFLNSTDVTYYLLNSFGPQYFLKVITPAPNPGLPPPTVRQAVDNRMNKP
jgi:hypothetical protein